MLMLALPAVVVAGGVYKWVDEQGRTHYGDKPPAGQAQSVDIDAAPAAAADQPAQQFEEQAVLKAMEEDRAEKKEQRAEEDRVRAQRKASCDQATANLNHVRTAGYLYVPTADPKNPRILDKNEHQAEIARAEQAVKQWCK